MKLPHTEMKFYLEVKSQTGLSSLRVSCKRALVVNYRKIVQKNKLCHSQNGYLMI